MNTNNMNNKKIPIPRFREIRDITELNTVGCQYINRANHSDITRIVTRSMRWLTVQHGYECISKEQERARRKIEKIEREHHNSVQKSLNLRILLDHDPRVKSSDEPMSDNTYIEKLLKIGADIRFIERNNKVKMVLQKSNIFIAIAQEYSQVVSVGYQYLGRGNTNGLYHYLEEEFDKQFSNAQKLAIKDGKIVLAKASWGTRIKKAMDLSDREWIIIFIGALVGALMGFALTSLVECL